MSDTVQTHLSAFSTGLEAAVAAVAPSLVTVLDGGATFSGIVWREGLVVTAEELLRKEEGLRFVRADGATVTAELAGRDPSTNVALLRGETGPAPTWVHGAGPAAVGAVAIVVGRRAAGPLAAFAIVAESGGTWMSEQGGRIDALIKLSAPMPHRIEGGAVVAADGSLLGLAAADPRRRGLVIPAATVDRAVAQLLAKGYVARGYLGLGLHPLARRGGAGVLVADVAEGSPAAAAGFLVGDTITTWDGETVRGMRDVARRLGTETAGTTARVGVIRAGAPVEISVTIGERRAGRADA